MRGRERNRERGDPHDPARRNGDADRPAERAVSENRHPHGDAQGASSANPEAIQSPVAAGPGHDVLGAHFHGAVDAHVAAGADAEGLRDDDELYGRRRQSGGGNQMKALAIDLGATSGRVMLGELEHGELVLEELHRFSNTPVQLPTGLYWDTLRLFHEIRKGLAVAGRERKLQIDAIGVDTWGVDIAFLGEDGALVDNPHHYRDARNEGVQEKAFAVVPQAEIFDATGIQFMRINSLYQWYAMKLADAPALRVAKKLLFMPDLFNYWLTGVARAERTIASTSQFYDPRKRAFASDMLAKFGLDASILRELIDPGTKLGPLLADIGWFTGLGTVPVYASGGHDTADAVVAVPAQPEDKDAWCYISSGTWSLMGVELDEPVID